MQQETKIQLSAIEQSLMKNAEWILTKNEIMEKMKQLLQQCLEKQEAVIKDCKFLFPENVINISPKISRGENYKGLPWLMLDYPRYFEKENIFAIRTFFWWGHCFSTTLHLSGVFKNRYAEKIIASHQKLNHPEFYSCINETEWHHHFTNDNYKPVNEIPANEFYQLISEKKFIKLSVKFQLEEWNRLPLLTASAYKTFLEIIN